MTTIISKDQEELVNADAASEAKDLKLKLFCKIKSKNKRINGFKLRATFDGKLVLNEEFKGHFWASFAQKRAILEQFKAISALKLHKGSLNERKILNAILTLGELIEDKIAAFEQSKDEPCEPFSTKFSPISILSQIPFTFVHPAQDFKENAYFGTFLYTEYKSDVNVVYTLITDKREAIPFDLELLKPLPMYDPDSKLRLEESPLESYKKELRWSPQSIKDYLNGCPIPQGIDVFNSVKKEYEFFMDFPDKHFYIVCPLWVIGTYCFTLFVTYPYLFFGGTAGVGKTKAVKLTVYLSFNGRKSANSSVPALFRTVQSARGCVGVDEAENLARRKRGEELRNLMLSGWEADSYFERTVETQKKVLKEHVLKRFENYCPKAIGNIAGIEGALGSRIIKINLLRTNKPSIGNREMLREKHSRWIPIRDSIYLWVLGNWKEIKKNYEDLKCPSTLKNREWQIWRPLLSIAKTIDENVFNQLKRFAISFSRVNRRETSLTDFELQLLDTLKEMCSEVNLSEPIYLKEVKNDIIERFDLNPKYVTESRIGKAMARMNFSGHDRSNTGVFYNLKKREVLDRYNRYVGDISVKKGKKSHKKVHKVHDPSRGGKSIKPEQVFRY